MTTITIIGNTTAAAELRYTPSGRPVANFTVAVNERRYDKTNNEWVDDGATFYPCAAWGPMGENAAELLADKGVRVIVTGRLKSRSYETREGEKRTVYEIDVDELGPSVKFATATVQRNGSSGGGGWSQPQQQPAQGGQWDQPQPPQQQRRPAPQQRPQAPSNDPWATPSLDEQPPF